MKKSNTITIVIILAVIIFASIIISTRGNDTPKELAKCIGKRTTLYVQLGCHACKIQEDMFGESYQYLNTIDCWFEKERCGGIPSTPTWVIQEKKYTEVLSIETLKQLTGC